MAFDLASAKPVDQPPAVSGGFDLSTAKPVSEEADPTKAAPGSKESVAKVTKAIKSIDDPAKLDEYKASLGLGSDVPYPELIAIEAKKRYLADKNRSTGERVMDAVSATAGGALTNMAAVPVLGGVGKGVSMLGGLGKMEKMGDVGRALSATGEVMKAQGPKALAVEGAALGATQQSVVDFLQEKYKMTKEAAENLTNGLFLAPAGVAAGSKILPKTGTQQAREVIQKLFGGLSGKVSDPQQAGLLRTALDKFGDGTTKEGTQALRDAIAAAAERQTSDAWGAGTVRADTLKTRQQTVAGFEEKKLPAMREQARVSTVGQGEDAEIRGRKAKFTAEQREKQLRDSLEQQKNADLPAVQNLVKGRAQMGDSVAFTPEGANVINYLENELAPSALNEVKHGAASENFLGKILRDLKGKEADPGATINFKGQTITKPPAPPKEPVTPRFLSDVKAWMNGRGIDPSLSQELGMRMQDTPGFFRKGGGEKDDLLEAARNKGWALPNEDDATVYANIRKIIQKELVSRDGNSDRPIHPGHLDEYAEWEQAMKDWDAQYGQAAKTFRAAEQEAAAGGLHDPNQLPASFMVWDDKRRELREIERSGKDGGFSEVQKQLAAESADLIESALKKYTRTSGEAGSLYERYLTNYHEGMTKLDAFKKDGIGGRMTGSKTKEIPAIIFDSRESFGLAQDALGYTPQQMDELALSHISDELSGFKTAEQAENWLKKQYWTDELTPQAQSKIASYVDQLKGLDKKSASAAETGKVLAGKASALPKQTADKVAEIQKQLLGQKKPVDHIQDLILTSKNNEPEMRAIYQAISQTPGGKQVFQDAVKSILGEQAQIGSKDLLKNFDNRVADILVSSGTHTPEEVGKLRDMVKTVEEIRAANVLTTEERDDAITKITDREVRKQSSYGILVAGALGYGVTTGHPTVMGVSGALGVMEAFGFATKGGYQRNFKRVETAMKEIIADPELMKAALAPASESQRLFTLLAQKLRKGAGLSIPQQAIGMGSNGSSQNQGD